MSFLTDAAWPAGLLTIFEIARKDPRGYESRYYGSYNKLLTYCFGPDSYEFYVAPQKPPTDLIGREAVDFVVHLVVFDAESRPVLVAEIKDDAWVKTADLRFKADRQIRSRFEAMLRRCPLQSLWVLSLLGTSVRAYHGEVASGIISPAFQAHPNPDRILPSDFLEGEWDVDILSQEGFKKMQGIVREIFDGAAQLKAAIAEAHG